MHYEYEALDKDAVEKYNKRRRPESKTRLQIHLGPAPFDGDPMTARIVLLMNNPGYDASTTLCDHKIKFKGWPIAGLHPDAPYGLRKWYSRPFGQLIKSYEAQIVSQRVAILQLNPWASAEFDNNCRLPSREKQFNLARAAAKRGAVMIIGRSQAIWKEALAEFDNIYVAKNCRNPTLTLGGLGAKAWSAVEAAIILKNGTS